MYFSRIILVFAVLLFPFSWFAFKHPERFIYGRRSAALTKVMGEEASKKLAKFVGVPLVLCMAACFLHIGIDHELTIRKAESGDADAQYRLAGFFYEGDFQADDFGKALLWYHRAARNGHRDAGKFIDAFLENPPHFTDSAEEIVEGYHVLAEEGLPTAQWLLGECYRQGQGVAIDEKQAFVWYSEAARSGYENAWGMLGYCYITASGTDKDVEKAAHWYRKHAEAGSVYSQVWLGHVYLREYPDEPGRLDRAYELFLEASLKNATRGLACYGMGYMFQYGKGRVPDAVQAWVLYSLAAERGHEPGQKAADFLKGHLSAKQLHRAQGMLKDLHIHYAETGVPGYEQITVSDTGSLIETGPVKTNSVVTIVRPINK